MIHVLSYLLSPTLDLEEALNLPGYSKDLNCLLEILDFSFSSSSTFGSEVLV